MQIEVLFVAVPFYWLCVQIKADFFAVVVQMFISENEAINADGILKVKYLFDLCVERYY